MKTTIRTIAAMIIASSLFTGCEALEYLTETVVDPDMVTDSTGIAKTDSTTVITDSTAVKKLIKYTTYGTDKTILSVQEYEYSEDGYTRTTSEQGVPVMKEEFIETETTTTYSLYNYINGAWELVCRDLDTYTDTTKLDLLTVESFNPDGSLYDKTVYEYIAPGQPESEITYDVNGTIIWKTIYTYTESGKIESYISYDDNGNITYKVDYTYTSSGDIESQTTFNGTYIEERTYTSSGYTFIQSKADTGEYTTKVEIIEEETTSTTINYIYKNGEWVYRSKHVTTYSDATKTKRTRYEYYDATGALSYFYETTYSGSDYTSLWYRTDSDAPYQKQEFVESDMLISSFIYTYSGDWSIISGYEYEFGYVHIGK